MPNAEHDDEWHSAFGVRHSTVTMAPAKPGCCNVVRFLADYLEKHLEPKTRADLEAHLQKCPRCVTQLRTYESTITMLRSLRDDDLPPDLRLTVRSFLD